MKKEDEIRSRKKRKMLLLLPLLLIPFVTIGFSLVKDGEPNPVVGIKLDKMLSTELPDAIVSEEQLDKMSYYNLAKADSMKRLEMIKNDPYYQQELQYAQGQSGQETGILSDPRTLQSYDNSKPQGGMNTSVYGGQNYSDPREEMVYNKINSLNAALNQGPQQVDPQKGNLYDRQQGNASGNEDIDRLEKMMKMMTANEGGTQDPEIDQLNGMLEKLLDVQHPERVQEKLRKTSAQKKGQVFTVSSGTPENMISLLQQQSRSSVKTKDKPQDNGFYALVEELQVEQQAGDIRAVVHETQVVVDGSVVKMRLLNDVFINGVLIPKDNFVFGIASLTGERLSIGIENIRFGSSIFPVKLAVYDMDGLNGIHIPGAIGRDVAKQSGSNALQGLGMTSLDPSLGMQAASAGIELTKNLLGKKVKLVKVTIKAGYQVLFKDENQKEQK